MTTFWWALGVFILVEGVLIFAIWKFRAKPGQPEPEQTHGNTMLEIIWTAIPAFILVMIAIPTVKTIFRTSDYATGEDVVQIEVIGQTVETVLLCIGSRACRAEFLGFLATSFAPCEGGRRRPKPAVTRGTALRFRRILCERLWPI